MSRRRIRALDVLARVKKQEAEAISRDLAALRAEIAAMEEEIADREHRMVHDIAVDTIEGSFYVAGYVRSLHAEIARLQERIKALQPRCDALEEAVRQVFAQRKSHETMADRMRLQMRQDRNRKEMALMEEQHLARWTGEESAA